MGRLGSIHIILMTLLIAVSGWANKPESLSQAVAPAPPVQALSFKKWKGQQVIDAQNRVVRLSNSIHLLESKKYQPTDGEPKNRLAAIKDQEATLDKALQQLQFSKELTMEDYYAVYLQKFANDQEALKAVTKTMSPDELAELLQILLRSKKSSKNQELNSSSLFSRRGQTEAGVSTF